MQDFFTWVGFLRDHASDADYRKDSDPTEAPKHYIDIDNYPVFVSSGFIPQNYDSVVAAYGLSFVIGNGTLPWATEAAFDSLRDCMQRLDFDRAQQFAADLGHYVADGHMPLHITRNYNGQYTGNSGIHSRYESTMINANIGQILYSGYDAELIPDVNQYIFDYIYTNYPYCDSVLAADNYAKTVSSNTSSSAYKTALWERSRSFTVPLFQRASHAMADLIFTAWIQAGSPALVSSKWNQNPVSENALLKEVSPNPFTAATRIEYALTKPAHVLLQVRDMEGNKVATLVNAHLPEGNYTAAWNPDGKASGIYLLVMNTDEGIRVKKMVYTGSN
jgi:hypothetical protein